MSQKINSLFFFGHCAQSCGYIDNMSKICRVCSVLLNAENCVPSFLKRNNVICRACDQNQANERTRKQRLIILNNLGGECQCCHMQNIDLLSIDHIYGGGHQENKNISWKKYIRTLFHLPIENLRLKYRCLCYNCNYTLGFWGKCPHTLSSYAGETLLITE